MYSGGSEKGAGTRSGRRELEGRVQDPDLDLLRIEAMDAESRPEPLGLQWLGGWHR